MSSLATMMAVDKKKIVGAIICRATVGAALQNAIPEIADDYRNGASQPTIAKKYRVAATYGIGEAAAIDAVGHALRGYDGQWVIPYEGLLDPEELPLLREENLRRRTEHDLEHKLGIFSVPAEKRQQMNARIASSGGAAAYAQRKGIHALTFEQRSANGKVTGKIGGHKGGIAATLAKGDTPWYVPTKRQAKHGVLAEIEFAYKFWDPRRKNMAYIVELLNNQFHKGKPIRNLQSVSGALSLYRKRLGVQPTVAKQPIWHEPTLEEAAGGAVGEVVFLYSLWQEKKPYAAMVQAVNDEYHNGAQVRTWGSVSGALSRYRKRIENQPST